MSEEIKYCEKRVEQYKQQTIYAMQEIERLHSIIKEVREWILYQQGHNITTLVSIDELDELLEILDKENKEWKKKLLQL